MPAIHVDTWEDFERARGLCTPVYITSKRRGPVLVPCANTLLVRTELVIGNSYNPNSVPEDRMHVLMESILDNGFCFPIVAIWDDDRRLFVVIDGFHRRIIGGEEWLDFDYLPVVVLEHDIARRMIATMQFNKAKGVHQVDLDAEVIRALIEQGVAEEEIAQRLGLPLDTIHRYKQVTGVAELFRNAEWSLSWEIVEESDRG